MTKEIMTKKERQKIETDFDRLTEKAIHHYGLFLAVGEVIDYMIEKYPWLDNRQDKHKPYFENREVV